jgi:2-polyprenyl-3-methyl-5-hydroxy-6-metoxy-1,4-benzoquinol methylase
MTLTPNKPINPTTTPPAPDVVSSADAYARRFAGPIGAYLLNEQNQTALRFAKPWRSGTVLDVGGGHAQLAVPMVNQGYNVTILASETSCLDRPNRLLGSRVNTAVGSLLNPPFPDQSFDVVLAFRMLAHIPDWQTFIRNLCRVARHAVIVDFPTIRSTNAATPLLFSLKHKVEHDTRRYLLYRRSLVRFAFLQAGFNVTRERGQFLFPLALHRLLKRPTASRILESLPRALGLTNLLGSPIILCATRSQSLAPQSPLDPATTLNRAMLSAPQAPPSASTVLSVSTTPVASSSSAPPSATLPPH